MKARPREETRPSRTAARRRSSLTSYDQDPGTAGHFDRITSTARRLLGHPALAAGPDLRTAGCASIRPRPGRKTGTVTVSSGAADLVVELSGHRAAERAVAQRRRRSRSAGGTSTPARPPTQTATIDEHGHRAGQVDRRWPSGAAADRPVRARTGAGTRLHHDDARRRRRLHGAPALRPGDDRREVRGADRDLERRAGRRRRAVGHGHPDASWSRPPGLAAHSAPHDVDAGRRRRSAATVTNAGTEAVTPTRHARWHGPGHFERADGRADDCAAATALEGRRDVQRCAAGSTRRAPARRSQR